MKVHEVDDLNCEHFFTFSQITFTRGDRYKIFIERSNTRTRQNYFINRIVNIWNNLAFSTKNVDTLNGFKNAVDRELEYLMYDYDE